MVVYGYPELGRFGLTHGILAWARCAIWCETTGTKMIAPIWLRPRIGPYLRKERDKRNYFLLFRSGSAISGLRRFLLLAFGKRIEIGSESSELRYRGLRSLVCVFRNAVAKNEEKFFSHVVGHGPFLRKKLLEITKTKFHPKQSLEPFIAVHVRLGDFSVPAEGEINKTNSNIRLPILWYVDRIIATRRALNKDLPVIIFSDGSDEDLLEITSLPNSKRSPKQQSVTDLLEMGNGAVVVSSGSGFSLWGAFLGSAPRLCHPKQMVVPAFNDIKMEIESGVGESLPLPFVASIQRRIDAAH